MGDGLSVEMTALGAAESLAQVLTMGASDPPITASLGPIDRLIRQLKSLEGCKHTLPVGVRVNQIGKLREHLETFRKPLNSLSEMEETSFRAKWWMKEVRELCYDTEDYLVQSGASVHGTLGRIASIIISWIQSKLKWRTRLSRFMARAGVLKETCEQIIDEEIKAAISLQQRTKAAISLENEMEADMEILTAQLFDMMACEDDKKPQLRVVIISGSAGSGKTRLARNLYVKCRMKFLSSAFVRVSRNPDFRSLLTSIHSQIKAPSPPGLCGVQGLICSISDHLQGKRYFIVIDDVRSPSVWDIISRAFPVGNFRSRIIVTTRSEQVEAAYSGYMLKSAIFRLGATGDGCCTNASTKEKSEALNIRYNNLPLHLKTCLLYLGMHPEGCTIQKDDLTKQWVAEGFIPALKAEKISEIPQNKIKAILEISQYGTEEIAEVPRDGISDMPQDQPEPIARVNQDQREEIAGYYFDELVTRGMIQPVDRNHKGEILSCTVHNMVLDLIRYKSKEDNFLVVVDNLESTLGHPDKVRRLSVQFGCEKGASTPESIILSHVRSLTFYGFLECVPSVVDYGLLCVLNLHIWADEDKIFDLTKIGDLCHLRYLKIECNIPVRLPLKIRRLQHLGTLELDAKVVSIPSDIGYLKKLLHVRCPCKTDVRDLGELTNLLDLQLTCYTDENLEDNMKCTHSVVEKLISLRYLALVPASGACSLNTQHANPSRMCISGDSLCTESPASAHIQRLELSRHCCIFSRVPKWTGELHDLCILKIAVRELSRQDIDILKGMPKLTALSLHVQPMSAGRIVFGNEGFSVLTNFKLMCTVPCLEFETDAMPNLEKLKLCFNSPIVDEQGNARIIIIERLLGLKEICAIIGSAGVDAESAWQNAIKSDIGNPKVQVMGWIYSGDQGRGMDAREGSGEDDKIEADLRDNMQPESSQLSVPAHSREDEPKDRPFILETISIPSDPESRDGNTGHVVIRDSKLSMLLAEEIPQAPVAFGLASLGTIPPAAGSSSCILPCKQPISPGTLSPRPAALPPQRFCSTSTTTPLDPSTLLPAICDSTISKSNREARMTGDLVRTETGTMGSLPYSQQPPNQHIGLAMGALGSLLPKLVQLLTDEYNQLKGLRKDVEFLQRELRSMHAVLHKLAGVPRDQLDEQVRLWVNEVRELSYNMEYVVDRFLVRVEGPDDPVESSHKLKRLMKKMAELFTKGKARHQIADTIKDIKGQVEDVAARRDRYRVDNIVANPNATTTVDPRLLALYKDKKDLVGIKEACADLINRLAVGSGDDASMQHLKILSIVGFGGLGKTTLAKAVYDGMKDQFESMAFVSVGRNPDLKKLVRNILYELDKLKYMSFNEAMFDERQLIDELRSLLQNKRYFIVIDDIWDTPTWEIVKCAFVDSNLGSRIVTTTRIFQVATTANDVYKMKALSEENSRELFLKRLFGSKYNQPAELSEKILQKCGGVPLAIITIASLLAGKPNEEWPQ
ncbi:unnamed protein product [Alopecurus aequalis]